MHHLPSANIAGTFYSCLWDAWGRDTIITDFGPGQGDVLEISHFGTSRLFYGFIPTGFTGAALLYIKATGPLYTDTNGSLTGGLGLVAELTNHAALTIGDFLWV